MAPVCRPPAWPDGLVIIRPYLTTCEKPKATFMTLPQELRDHICSMSLVHNGPISFTPYKCHNTKKIYCTLTRVCRTLREDVTKLFWSKNQFVYDARQQYSTPAPFRNRHYLGMVTDVFVVLDVGVKGRSNYRTHIRLVRIGGTWEVMLEGFKFSDGDAGPEKNNKMEFSALLEPDMARAKRMLNTHGRLTPALLPLIRRVGNCAFSA